MKNICIKITRGHEKRLSFGGPSPPLPAPCPPPPPPTRTMDDEISLARAKASGNRLELRVSCASRRVAVDGFVCVYQNTHLIIPRIAVGAESGYAAAVAYSALNSHLDP